MKYRNLVIAIIILGSSIGYQSCKHDPLSFLIEDGAIVIVDTTNPGPIIPCNPDTVYFQNNIIPLILSNCAIEGCHDSETHEEGYDMSTYTSILNDEDLVVPGNSNESKMVDVLYESGDDKMPPTGYGSLSSSEKQMIKDWIDQGALNNYCDDCDTLEITFTNSIEPLVASYCLGCHSGADASGSIDLTSYTGVAEISADGSFYGSINHESGFTSMPLGGSWLLQCDIDQVKTWIDQGFPNN